MGRSATEGGNIYIYIYIYTHTYIYLLYVVTDLVEQSVLEAGILSSGQEILCPLWDSKFRNCFHQGLPLDLTLNYINPIVMPYGLIRFGSALSASRPQRGFFPPGY